jgi:hypothetical protein
MSTADAQSQSVFLSRRLRARAGGPALAFLGAIAIGVAIGMLTDLSQGRLTSNSLLNSEAAWLVAPFAFGALGRRPRAGAGLGLLTCVMQLAGYEFASELRYGAMPLLFDVGWGFAALIGGPLFGLAGRAWRFGRPGWRGLGPAALAAAFLTEGAWQYLYELHRVVQGGLWLAIGCAIALAGLRRGRDLAWLAVAVAAGLLIQFTVTHTYGPYADSGQRWAGPCGPVACGRCMTWPASATGSPRFRPGPRSSMDLAARRPRAGSPRPSSRC